MSKFLKIFLLTVTVLALTVALIGCEFGNDTAETTVGADTAADTAADVTTTEEATVEETTAEEITTAEETTIEETTVEETTEEETTVPQAGTDSGLTRDGTPKKYFTLSFDDGITQDLKIIEILKKYDVDCISFNINTGLYGANWEWVGRDALHMPEVTHIRFTKAEIETGIYNGYDVCVHTLTHPSLKNYDNNARMIKKEVAQDAENITKLTGIEPVGMAWPGGDTEYTDTTIKLVLENSNIRFARGTTSTYKFTLPEYFMKWMPTCAINDARTLTLAQQFIDAECTEDMLFYVWGHGYELQAANSYDRLEQLVKMMSEADDVVLVTNSEFYQLFKDQIPAWKE